MIPFPLFVEAFLLFLAFTVVYRVLSASLFLYLGAICFFGLILVETAGVWSMLFTISRALAGVQGAAF